MVAIGVHKDSVETLENFVERGTEISSHKYFQPESFSNLIVYFVGDINKKGRWMAITMQILTGVRKNEFISRVKPGN